MILRVSADFLLKDLRSPMFFHPAPADIEALLAFSQKQDRCLTWHDLDGDATLLTSPKNRARLTQSNRTGERFPDLIEIPGCVGKEVSKHKKKKNKTRKGSCSKPASEPKGPAVNERDRRDYFTPSSSLFRDFIEQDIVKRYGLDNHGHPWKSAHDYFSQQENADNEENITMIKGEVSALDWHDSLHVEGWDRLQGFSMQLACGTRLGAKAVVCAIGPGATPRVAQLLPEASKPLSRGALRGPGWCHSTAIGSNGEAFPPPSILKKTSSTLVVIGGGLTSAQICDVAIRSGIDNVVLILRGYMKGIS